MSFVESMDTAFQVTGEKTNQKVGKTKRLSTSKVVGAKSEKKSK